LIIFHSSIFGQALRNGADHREADQADMNPTFVGIISVQGRTNSEPWMHSDSSIFLGADGPVSGKVEPKQFL